MKLGSAVETVLTGYGLIEGPCVDDDDALYFCDARLGGVYRRTPDGEVETVVPRRKGVGGVVLHQDGGIVVSGRDLSHVHGGRRAQSIATPTHLALMIFSPTRRAAFTPEAFASIPLESKRIQRRARSIASMPRVRPRSYTAISA